MRLATKRWAWTVTLLISYLLFGYFFIPHARADGGAPNLAYISGTSKGVSVIDVGQAKIIRTIIVLGDPHTILLSQDGGLLYVTQPDLGQVSIIKASTGSLFCAAHIPGNPSLLALDPDVNILYAAGNGSGQVTALDPTNCKILHTLEVDGPVYGLAIALTAGSSINNGVSNQIWVASTHKLTIFDNQSDQMLGSIPIPDGPRNLSIPPGETVYVTTHQGSVDIISLKTREVRQILRGGIFGQMDYDALTGEVYVPDEQHQVLNVISPLVVGASSLPSEPERVIHTQGVPEAVAITNDGLLGFIALGDGKVAMWDLIAHRLVYTVDVGGRPHFIITGLYPPPIVNIPTPVSNTTSLQEPAIPKFFWGIVFSVSLVTLIIVTVVLFWQLRRSL